MIGLLVPVARALVRLLTPLLLATVALVGIAAALFSVQSGTSTLSLPNLAEIVGLPSLRESVADLLGAVEAPGPTALLSLLGGLGAILLGALMVVGSLVARAERAFVADESPQGQLDARPRALAAAARGLALGTRGVTSAKAKATSTRRGGRLALAVTHPRSASPDELRRRLEDEVRSVHEGFAAKTTLKLSIGERGGSRVE